MKIKSYIASCDKAISDATTSKSLRLGKARTPDQLGALNLGPNDISVPMKTMLTILFWTQDVHDVLGELGSIIFSRIVGTDFTTRH